MSKQSGLGDHLFIAGVDLSGDIGSLGAIGGGPTALDVTPINKSGFERLGGLRDGRFEYSAFFNPGPEADAAHDALKVLPRTDVQMVYGRGLGLGRPACAIVAKQTNYDGTRGNDGALTFSVSAPATGYGIEWGEQATPGVRDDTAAANGDSIDGGAASAFGLQAYLQVLDFTGTSVTAKLQQSSDNGVGDAWADVAGAGFVAATGPSVQRIATAGNLAVERYLRVVTTGTFSAASFLVVVVRNPVATVF